MPRHVVDYEAQAAIELEGLAVDEEDEPGYALRRGSMRELLTVL